MSGPTPATFSFLAILQVKKLPLRNSQEEIARKNSDSKLPWGPECCLVDEILCYGYKAANMYK